MTFTQQLGEYVRACFSGIWVESHEHQDAIIAIAQLCRQENWQLATWDIEQGLFTGSGSEGGEGTVDASDPLTAVRALGSMATPDGTTLLVLQNFHRFLSSPEIIQAVTRAVVNGKTNRTFVVVLAPCVNLPAELDKLFVVLEHELPDREQLAAIARGIATEEGEMPSGSQWTTLLDASAGLTRFEAEGAFSLSLVREGRLTAETVWKLKSGMLKKSGLLGLHRNGEDFSQLGGLEGLKAFCRRATMRSSGRSSDSGDGPSKVRARGVMLLGTAGVGKSAFAKALGAETGRPTLTLDIGALMGSLVGQTESNVRKALQIADAMAPSILFVDEVEKALSGAAGGAQDSGVSARLFGTLLSWMNDRNSDVFLVATCNDISKLPPEFVRAERFDGVFFLDLPSEEQREQIWRIHMESFGLDADQRRPDDSQWTGAEIRSCCRLAALLDLSLVDAAQNVVPIAVTASETVENLRNWASGRCLSADRAGIYRHESQPKSRRRVNRSPSNN